MITAVNPIVTVTAGGESVALTHFEGRYAALCNVCPHQGGPLGEGSIEKGLLRCPWHGWDYDPLTGKAPGFDDGVESFPVEVRDDGNALGHPVEDLGGVALLELHGGRPWTCSLDHPAVQAAFRAERPSVRTCQ